MRSNSPSRSSASRADCASSLQEHMTQHHDVLQCRLVSHMLSIFFLPNRITHGVSWKSWEQVTELCCCLDLFFPGQNKDKCRGKEQQTGWSCYCSMKTKNAPGYGSCSRGDVLVLLHPKQHFVKCCGLKFRLTRSTAHNKGKLSCKQTISCRKQNIFTAKMKKTKKKKTPICTSETTAKCRYYTQMRNIIKGVNSWMWGHIYDIMRLPSYVVILECHIL